MTKNEKSSKQLSQNPFKLTQICSTCSLFKDELPFLYRVRAVGKYLKLFSQVLINLCFILNKLIIHFTL